MMNVGFIGLGALGSALAGRFLSGGGLTVWDINPAAVAAFRQRGAATAATAAELARRCDVVLLCLPRSSDVHQAIFGAGGLAEGLSPGKLVIDQTSGIPTETRATAAALAERGVEMIDAAVSAGPALVTQGGATLMASGPEAMFQRAMPVLQVITGTVLRCGARVGDGQAMKMVNNAMNASCRLGTLEAVVIGRKMGLTLQRMGDAMTGGLAANQTTEKMLPALMERKASTNFSLALMLKDVNQAVSLGMEVGAPMPIASAVRSLLQFGCNSLGALAQLEDVVGLIESMAATRLVPMEGDNAPTPDPEHPDQIADLVGTAVTALNLLVTLECTAAGLKYGLTMGDMSDVLNRSSGWSGVSRQILPALASGQTVPSPPLSQVVRDVRLAAKGGIECGAPMVILNAVRSVLEASSNERGSDAALHDISRSYEAMAGTSFGAAPPG